MNTPNTDSVLLDTEEKIIVRDALRMFIRHHSEARDRARYRNKEEAEHHQGTIDCANRLRDRLR